MSNVKCQLQLQPIVIQGSQTLGKSKKHKSSQRHSAGNIDYDNLPGGNADDIPAHSFTTFRTRSKTVGDAAGLPSNQCARISKSLGLFSMFVLFCSAQIHRNSSMANMRRIRAQSQRVRMN